MYSRFTSAVGVVTLGILGGIFAAVATKQASFELKTNNKTRRWGKDSGNDATR